jgi:low temperature requirement protein LtrA
MSESEGGTRVSTLELFFDLVFVFTITQLTGLLEAGVTLAAAGRVLLIFGVLWWMYGGYAWLTNERTPAQSPERLLLLVGMAGFLVIGLSIPHAFGQGGAHGRDGLWTAALLIQIAGPLAGGLDSGSTSGRRTSSSGTAR